MQSVIDEGTRSGTTARPEQILLVEDSPSQAAVYMGVSRQRLEIWRCRGGGPPYSKLSAQRGGAVRYKRSDLDAFMAACRISNTGERPGE